MHRHPRILLVQVERPSVQRFEMAWRILQIAGVGASVVSARTLKMAENAYLHAAHGFNFNGFKGVLLHSGDGTSGGGVWCAM